MSRRRFTRTRVDRSYLESLRALERLYELSGGGRAGKASGEVSSISAASSGYVLSVDGSGYSTGGNPGPVPRGWYTSGDSTQGIPR